MSLSAYTEAFLDIETTGLSSAQGDITVVGIQLSGGSTSEFCQLVGREVTAESLLAALAEARVIYTYNGSRFDLPFIHERLGIDLTTLCPHRDLMFDCWRQNLYGGLKCVERQLGIPRRLKDVNGYEAVRLWWEYVEYGDEKALKTLLEYNREDVINLMALRELLC